MNTEHQLKSKLTWPECPKSMKTKILGGRQNEQILAGGGSNPTPSPPSKENPDLHSSLRFFKYFFSFKATHIPCLSYQVLSFILLISNGACAKALKFQNMTSLVEKICINMETSMGYYLLNRVLASMCSCSEKSWISFSVYDPLWTVMTLLFTATSFFACVHDRYDTIWYYLNWTLVLIFTKKISFCPES